MLQIGGSLHSPPTPQPPKAALCSVLGHSVLITASKHLPDLLGGPEHPVLLHSTPHRSCSWLMGSKPPFYPGSRSTKSSHSLLD